MIHKDCGLGVLSVEDSIICWKGVEFLGDGNFNQPPVRVDSCDSCEIIRDIKVKNLLKEMEDDI